MEEIKENEEYVNEIDLGIKHEYFGDMLQYVLNDNITDVEWDGTKMKIEDLTTGERFVDTTLTEDFCDKFAKRVADRTNQNYNDSQPKLEAETSNLRITILGPSVATSGTNINLRKIDPKVRMDQKSVIEKKYCDIATRNLIMNFFRSGCSGILTGGTGTGKTELLKFGAQWIPDLSTVVTLEDTNELKLKQIYPNKFIRPCIIGRNFTWSDGIDYALRANAQYLLMAEARSEEVQKVLEIASTSCAIVTCIHSKDIRQLPDRIDNMIGAGANGVVSKENDVYTFFDYAIKIAKKTLPGQPPYRYIEQLGIFERNGKENQIHMIVEDGNIVAEELPEYIQKHFQKYELKSSLKEMMGEEYE